MWDAMDVDPGEAGGPSAGKPDSGAYDHLIDAERESLVQSGRAVDKIALIKAIRGVTSLDLRDAKRVVEGYLARRGGTTSAPADPDRRGGWIDDLLDAERAAASRMDRPINKIALIKALRGASPVGLKEAKDAVEDYLRRRGGEGLPSGSGGWGVLVSLALIALLVAVVAFAALR